MSMITKDKLFKTIEEMPDSFTMDDFLDKILLLQKIETGLRQSENNEVLTTEEAKRELDKWLK